MKVIFGNLQDSIRFENINFNLHIVIGKDNEGILFYVDDDKVARYMISGEGISDFDEEFAISCKALEVFNNDKDAQDYIMFEMGKE